MSLLNVRFAGPRPLGEGDLLFGRDEQLRQLQDACGSRDVITLTAWSGVGKSSFVSAGLLPHLRTSSDYLIYPEPLVDDAEGDGGEHKVRERGWAQFLPALQGADAEATPRQLAERIYRDIVGLEQDTGRKLIPDLRDHLNGRRAVVVLDQFEELLRYYGALGEALLRLVARVAPKVGAHIIIARSEYRERLRPVEEALDVSVETATLNEIGASTIPEIFRGPFLQAGVTVDEGVTDLLVEWWSEARRSTGAARIRQVGSEGLADVGLLHFQAMALAFTDWIKAHWEGGLEKEFDAGHLTVGLLNRYVDARDIDGNNEGGGGWIFEDALVTYVRQQVAALSTKVLERPQPIDTDESALLPPLWWKQGPALMTARVAPTFTVAGFKQPQALYSLLPHAIGEETSTNAASRLAEEIQKDPTQAGALLAKESKKVEPAGVALLEGRAREELLPEMVDSLNAGLFHLSERDVNVFRKLERPGEPVFELVHDGMGAALKQWSTEYLAQPLADLAVIGAQTAKFIEGRKISPAMIEEERQRSGLELDIWGSVGYDASIGDGTSHIIITGLSFPSGALEGCVFENVTLRDCTFRGASFIACQFKNVVFENCDLKALLFMAGSTLDGVRFTNANGKEDALDLLTIKGPRVADAIAFESLKQTTGLFLQGLPAGRWTFTNSTVRHLVLSANGAEGPTFEFEDSDAFGVSSEGSVALVGDEERIRLIALG